MGSDQSSDMLSRWMAYYIAEQIEAAETATDDEPKRRCFETILKLWQLRAVLPGGNRPFKSFEPIFRALEGLDPDNHQTFFFRHKDRNLSFAPSVEHWVDIANQIDRIARIWLEYVFQQAALCATDNKTKKWLNKAIGSEDEVLIIDDITYPYEDSNEKKREKIVSRIEQLKSFNDLNKHLLTILQKELKDLPVNKKSETQRKSNKINDK